MLETRKADTGTDADKNILMGRFSSEQLHWLDKARQFARAVSLDEVMASDRDNVFRRDMFEAACREGFGSLPFNPQYGGSGADYVSFCLINEEFGRRCLPVMSSLGVHVLCQEPVNRFGTPEQKEKYLRGSADGTYLAAFGLTEPNAGSDTAAIETTARLSGDHYLLNGTKTFITSGASADYFIVMAKLIGEASQDATDSGAAKRGGNITAFIVEKDYPGFSIGQKFDMLGMRGYSTCEIVFSDCQVPSHNLLGQHGEGRKVALSSLAKGRVTIAAQAVGWAQGALDALLIELQRHYRDGDLTLANEFNGMAVKLGDLAVKVEAARALMYQAARFVDAGESNVSVAGMAKTMATDTAMLVAGQAIDMLGSDGLKNELLLERIFRDAKAGQIYEGTNQIQRMLIARDLLK